MIASSFFEKQSKREVFIRKNSTGFPQIFHN